MESESKTHKLTETESTPQEAQPSTTASGSGARAPDRKDDEEEEEEEEEEDKIVETSLNGRFHKRNKRFPKPIKGVDSAFVAIEPKSGKEVIWNECLLPEKRTEKENRYLSIIKKLKRNSHPFLARFLDAWIAKSEDGPRRLIFITERLDECSLKQFLCNSAGNPRSWKRHVGQILSVLMFLHRLDMAHGNLTKETIYYQNSGNLRVGPFTLLGCLDRKSQSADIFALGVVALEIAVWTPTEFPQTLSQPELIQEMLARLENSDRRNFIETCLDPNPPAGDRIKRLINHPAVTEVPVLKLLSAKVIVSTMRSVSSEEGATVEQTGFATLLKEYLSHYEDETIIVEVHFAREDLIKSRSWKDFRSNFTLTAKFLDDVKNGFYPLFGCRWIADQVEEDESLITGCPTYGITGTSSAGSFLGRGEISAVPSQVQSSGTSTVPSASVSRKHSAATRASEAMGAVPTVLEDDDGLDEADVEQPIAIMGRSASLCEPVTGQPSYWSRRSRQSDSGLVHHQKPLFQSTLRSISADDGGSNRSGTSFVYAATPELSRPMQSACMPLRKSAPPLSAHSSSEAIPVQSVSAPGVSTGSKSVIPSNLKAADTTASVAASDVGGHQVTEKMRRSTDDLVTSTTSGEPMDAADQQQVVPKADSVGGSTVTLVDRTSGNTVGQEVSCSKASVGEVAGATGAVVEENRPLSDKAATTLITIETDQDKHVEEGEEEVDEEDEDDKDDEDDDDNEDEDDEDDENKLSDTAERIDPQTIHVAAPERAPTQPALFTHCQYFYIGAGRWQVYVQMWFVEERLKREAYVQVFDYEWHDYERVADLFEASRCLNPADRPSLLRLLELARHNCPLIYGELQLPRLLRPRPGHFDAFELHEKLTLLRLHQQARDQMQRGTEAQENGGPPEITRCPSVCTSGLDTDLPTSVADEKDVAVPDSRDAITDARLVTVLPDEVPACADHVAQLQQHQRVLQQPVRGTTTGESDAMRESHTPARPPPVPAAHASGGNTLFVDVGALAPHNAYCALCDTHDYLHHVDLPAYLISPCYHCREALAREAKISPEVLLDLHMQHSIPWPAFLQARFNIPVDDRSLEDLIAYDCRWRSRQPCRCLVSSGGPLLPPCVEFSWLCPPAPTTWNDGVQCSSVEQTVEVGKETVACAPTSTTNTPVEASAQATTAADNRHSSGETKATSPPHQPTSTSQAEPTAPAQVITRGPLPCAARHPRGAPTTCCHGIQFPRLGITPGPTTQPQVVHQTPTPETCQASVNPPPPPPSTTSTLMMTNGA